ncbi:MAG: hypothetical protein ACP5U0_05245, partial [Caldisphaera sp.]
KTRTALREPSLFSVGRVRILSAIVGRVLIIVYKRNIMLVIIEISTFYNIVFRNISYILLKILT